MQPGGQQQVRSRVAREKAAKKLRMAAIQQEIEMMDVEGEEEALDAADEAFEQELRNTDAFSRRSVPESGEVNHWAPGGHMRRVQVAETRTSCMVVCGPSGGSGSHSPLSQQDSSGMKKATLRPWWPRRHTLPVQMRRQEQNPLA